MSNTSYNFKDNLTIDNNKYLKWLDSTGTSRSNIIALDTSNDLHVNSAEGSIYLNSNNSGSSTFINSSNSSNVIVASKLGVGFNSTSNVSANLTIAKNGYIGVNTTQGTNDGYLGLSGSHTLTNTSGSRILLYGVDNTTGNSGKVMIYGGNNTNGSVDIFTGNDSRKLQINNSGTALFTPDGTTVRCSINDSTTTFTNTVVLSNTNVSTSATTGALQIAGGLGVIGNCFVDGTLSINSMTGNINFDSSQTSSSYTTGAIYISGGLGISNTVNASSVTSGGGLSVAGGVAIGKSLFVGGNVVILDSTAPTSAQTGSVVLYGGLGINNAILSRTNNSPQIRLAPVSDGSQTSIAFFSKSDFDTLATGGSSTWWVGQNVGSIDSGNFGIHSVQTGTILTAGYNGFIGIGTTNPTGQLDIQLGSHNIRIYNDGVPAISSSHVIRLRPLGLELFGNGTNPPYFDIRNTAGSIVTRFNSNGDPNYVTVGRFGIGTNNPTTLLHVAGDGLFTSTLESVNATTGGAFTINGGLAVGKSAFFGGPILQIPLGNTASRPSPVTKGSIRYNTETDQFEGFGAADTWGTLGGVVDVDQDTKILAENGAGTDDDNLRFFTAGSERMRLNSSGNVGIGTTSPQNTLEVLGTARITNGITTNNLLASGISTGQLDVTNVASTTLNVSSQMTAANLWATNITASGALISNNTLGNIFSTNITAGNVFSTNLTTSNVRISGVGVGGSVNNYSITSGALNISGDTVINGNEILFTTTGVNPPTLSSRSPGTKVVLFPQVGVTQGDFSIGVQSDYTNSR
jgi:hypothetical protein